MFLGVGETNVGSLACCGVAVVFSVFSLFCITSLVIASVRNTKKLPSYIAKNKYMTKNDLELDQGWLELMERALKRRVGLFRQL